MTEELLKAEILDVQAGIESGMGTEAIAHAIIDGEWFKEQIAVERISGLSEAAYMLTQGMRGDEMDYPALKEARGYIEEKIGLLIESVIKTREARNK